MTVTEAESRFVDKPTIKGDKRSFIYSILLDVLFVVLLYLLMLVFHQWVPEHTQYFMVNDPSISKPLVPSILPNYANAIANWLAPVLILLVQLCGYFQVDTRSVCSVCSSWVVRVPAIACAFTGLFWVLYGGLRPNFLATCNPDMSRVTNLNAYYTSSICTTQPMDRNDFQAFPSGHASTTWASWTYIALYLTHHLRPFDGTGHFWKLIVSILLPSLLPFAFSTTRIVDFHHSFAQILMGSLIGFLSAYLAYRLNYIHKTRHHNAHIPARSYYLMQKEGVE